MTKTREVLTPHNGPDSITKEESKAAVKKTIVKRSELRQALAVVAIWVVIAFPMALFWVWILKRFVL